MALSFQAAVAGDADALADLRLLAMRESLERIDHFDPVRARQRLLKTFSPAHTRHVLHHGQRVGLVVVRQDDQGQLLDHLYIHPDHQRQGIGAAVLAVVCTEADAQGLALRLGALRGSDANRFYLRHGFVLSAREEWDNYYVRAPRPRLQPESSAGPGCTRVHQHIHASRAAVYRALLDAQAVVRWKVPDGMTSQVHQFDAREGGAFRVSLTYDAPGAQGKTGSHTDTYRGHFARLVPDTQVVEVMEFETDDLAMRGTMTVTCTLSDARGGGTDLLAVHEGLPPGVAPADNETGWRMALGRLALLLEPGPDGSKPGYACSHG